VTIVVVVLVVLVVAAGGVAWAWRPDIVVRRQVRHRCVVTMKDGQAFTGVLWSADLRCLVLRETQMLQPGDVVAVDGEVLLARSDVAYIQLPNA
jgi:small nuclear ribonucleoprotein (snRNP)-like protein